ncbi:peptidoglycan bridge formation glycyltransferase FemA/FemB family protein [Chloroflexota bacterium]
MKISVDILRQEDYIDFEEFVKLSDSSLIYTSIKYKNFLEKILVNSKSDYLIAREGSQLVGALPTFTIHNKKYGNVLNSLPFYGSNGGIIVSPKISNTASVIKILVEEFNTLAISNEVSTSTLITNPLDKNSALIQGILPHSYTDMRIGQIKMLPSSSLMANNIEDTLMNSYHKKTRNSIRKALKSDLLISHSDSLKDLQKLSDFHNQGIKKIGGISKPWNVFLAIRESFEYNIDYRLYLAQKENKIISALLVFYYHKTAEYFTPATDPEYRIYQPMSLLIHTAMEEAAKRNCLYWNWGGTWMTQENVYKFKSRWGTEDHRYYYLIQKYDNRLQEMTKEKLLKEYPNYYVLPFSELTPTKS